MQEKSENFTTDTDKTNSIFNWFQSQSKPTYNKYRLDLGNQSNIVEYEDVLKLYKNRNLTRENIASIL